MWGRGQRWAGAAGIKNRLSDFRGSWPQTEHRVALSVHGLVAKRPLFLSREGAGNSLSACMMFELLLMDEQEFAQGQVFHSRTSLCRLRVRSGLGVFTATGSLLGEFDERRGLCYSPNPCVRHLQMPGLGIWGADRGHKPYFLKERLSIRMGLARLQ